MAIREYYNAASATATTSAQDFTFPAMAVRVTNDGANEVFVAVSQSAGAEATTADMELRVGETQTWGNMGIKSVGLICSGGETATVRVYAITGN